MGGLADREKPRFAEDDLIGFKYFKLIRLRQGYGGHVRKLLERLHGHRDHRNRLLHYDEYVTLLLLYFFNPVITSLRGIQFASGLKKVKRTLGVPRSSLGSLSGSTAVSASSGRSAAARPFAASGS